MQKTRENTILEVLGKKNNLTFTELKSIGKIGNVSLTQGLDELKNKKLVKRDLKTKRYILQTETKNKTLEILKKKNIINLDTETIEKLRDDSFPFETGYALLRSTMFTLSKLTLAQNEPDLTSHEKLEFTKLIKYHNSVIEKTFDVLYSINSDQYLALKKLLDTTITDPKIDMKLSGLANKQQKNRARRI